MRTPRRKRAGDTCPAGSRARSSRGSLLKHSEITIIGTCMMVMVLAALFFPDPMTDAQKDLLWLATNLCTTCFAYRLGSRRLS